jgi:hypothetical protein
MNIADICSRLEALTEAVKGIEVGLEEMSYRGAGFADGLPNAWSNSAGVVLRARVVSRCLPIRRASARGEDGAAVVACNPTDAA